MTRSTSMFETPHPVNTARKVNTTGKRRIVRGFTTLAALGLLSGLACSKDTKQTPTAEPPSQSATADQAAKDTPASTEAENEQPSNVEPKPTGDPAYALDSHEPDRDKTGTPAAAKDPKTNEAEPKADAPAGGAPTIRGAAVSGEGFRAHLQSAGKLQKGKAGSVQVVLEAVAPFHCNDKYPYKFTPSPTPGVTYAEAVVKNMKVGEQRSTMTVPFTAADKGEKKLTGELAFSVCTDDKCLIEKQKLSITVQIDDAS